MSLPTWAKRAYKKSVPHIPGYHRLCLGLRAVRSARWEWIDRLPVTPGLVVPLRTGVGDLVMTRPERCSIAKKFFWTEGVRKPEEDGVAIDLFAQLVRQADAVLDIGANSGLFSLVAARANPGAEIVAIDILPEALHILMDNLIANGLFDRVELQLLGVGRGGQSFYAPFEAGSSEMPTSLSLELSQEKGVRVPVPVKTLDEICLPRFERKRLVVKIDVEGTEVDIFRHGIRTLDEVRPCFICEVLPVARDLAAYDAILDQYSYSKFLITADGLKQHAQIKAHPRFKDWFFVAENASFEVGRIACARFPGTI